MKVIKHGKYIKERTCDKCGCVFEYLPKDVITLDNTDDRWLNPPPREYVIKCPECDYRIIFTKGCE